MLYILKKLVASEANSPIFGMYGKYIHSEKILTPRMIKSNRYGNISWNIETYFFGGRGAVS